MKLLEDDTFSSNEEYFDLTNMTEDGFNFSYDYMSGNVFHNMHSVMPDSAAHAYLTALDTYLSICVVLLGIIGNGTSFLMFVCSRIRRQAASVYLATLACSDTIVLICILLFALQKSLGEFAWIQPWCSIVMYTAYSSSFFSVWILVAFTIERYLSVCHPERTNRLLSANGVRLLMVGLAFLSLVLYLFVPFTRTIKVLNYVDRDEEACFTADWFEKPMMIIEVVDVLLTSIVPSAIIVVSNTLMVRADNKAQREAQATADEEIAMSVLSPITPGPDGSHLWRTFKRRASHLPQAFSRMTKNTKLLITISSAFVILNIPFGILRSRSAILHALGRTDYETRGWLVALKTTQFVFKFNFAINFLLYTWFKESFRKSLFEWCSGKKDSDGEVLIQKTGLELD